MSVKGLFRAFYVVLIVVGAVSGPAASEVLLSDEFPGDALNADLWTAETTGPMTLAVVGGSMHAVTPGKETAQGRITLNGAASGNFDAQILYAVSAYSGSDSDAREQLFAFSPAGFVVVYYHRFEVSRSEVIFAGKQGGSAEVYAYQTDAPDTGGLRIARQGTAFTASYWDGAAWKLLGTAPAFAEDASLRIQVESGGAFPALDFLAGRFRLEADKLASNLKFTTQPSGRKCYTGDKAFTLKAAATGNLGPVNYEWVFDKGSAAASLGNGAIYTLTSPEPGRSGSYFCKATDLAGTVQSKPATVQIADRIAFQTQPVEAKRYVDEGAYTLTTAATGGLAALTYTWKFDGGSGPTDVGTGPSYALSAPAPAHSGTYWCEASDGRNTVKSNPTPLLIADRIAFQTQPIEAKRYVDEGAYTLTAAATGGLAPLTYTWKFDGGSGTSDMGTGASCAINSPSPGNSGTYWCEASDGRDTVKSNPASVQIADRVTFQTQPVEAKRYVDEGAYTLTAAATGGLAPLTYTWKFDGGSGPSDVGTGPSYALSAPAPAHSGTYWCEASDGRDTVKSNVVTVTISERPPAPAPPPVAEPSPAK